MIEIQPMAPGNSTIGANPSAPRPRRALYWAARATEAGLVALIAFLAAQALWFMMYGDSVRTLDLAMDADAGGVGAARASDLSNLADAGLFAARGETEAIEPQLAPETRLNLVLRGVRRGGDPQSGAAFIEIPGQGQRSLEAGDEITDQVALEEIYEDRVVINRRGVRESLFLSEEAARRAQAGATRVERPAPDQAPRAAAGASPLSGRPVPSLARELSAEDWIDGLRLAPQMESGDVVGFRVRGNSHLEVLRAAGLLPGDIVTVLNGERLTGADAVSRAFALFEASDRIAVTVLRDGQAVQMNIPLN